MKVHRSPPAPPGVKDKKEKGKQVEKEKKQQYILLNAPFTQQTLWKRGEGGWQPVTEGIEW